MADIGLLHRADCHASGTAEQHSAAVKGAATIYLCAHHSRTHSERLTSEGWLVVSLDHMEAVPA